MKRLLLGVILLGVCCGIAQAETSSITYFVQLIVATNGQKPHDAKARIGPRLQKQPSPVFQWADYWEIARKTVAATIGKHSRIRLDKERELEIEHVSGERLVL